MMCSASGGEVEDLRVGAVVGHGRLGVSHDDGVRHTSHPHLEHRGVLKEGAGAAHGHDRLHRARVGGHQPLARVVAEDELDGGGGDPLVAVAVDGLGENVPITLEIDGEVQVQSRLDRLLQQREVAEAVLGHDPPEVGDREAPVGGGEVVERLREHHLPLLANHLVGEAKRVVAPSVERSTARMDDARLPVDGATHRQDRGVVAVVVPEHPQGVPRAVGLGGDRHVLGREVHHLRVGPHHHVAREGVSHLVSSGALEHGRGDLDDDHPGLLVHARAGAVVGGTEREDVALDAGIEDAQLLVDLVGETPDVVLGDAEAPVELVDDPDVVARQDVDRRRRRAPWLGLGPRVPTLSPQLVGDRGQLGELAHGPDLVDLGAHVALPISLLHHAHVGEALGGEAGLQEATLLLGEHDALLRRFLGLAADEGAAQQGEQSQALHGSLHGNVGFHTSGVCPSS